MPQINIGTKKGTRKHPSGANQLLATAKQGVVPIS